MSTVRGSLNATISGETDQVSLAHNGSGVFGQNSFFWHPQVVWKFLEATLRLWAFRACTGCKS